jgi:hypothetical protein
MEQYPQRLESSRFLSNKPQKRVFKSYDIKKGLHGSKIYGKIQDAFLCGSSSVVERQLPKLNVAGSNPVSRSKIEIRVNTENLSIHADFLYFLAILIILPVEHKMKSAMFCIAL